MCRSHIESKIPTISSLWNYRLVLHWIKREWKIRGIDAFWKSRDNENNWNTRDEDSNFRVEKRQIIVVVSFCDSLMRRCGERSFLFRFGAVVGMVQTLHGQIVGLPTNLASIQKFAGGWTPKFSLFLLNTLSLTVYTNADIRFDCAQYEGYYATILRTED